MALTITEVSELRDAVDRELYSAPAFTPTANSVLVVLVDTLNTTIFNVTSSPAMTWTLFESNTKINGWWALPGASPSSTTITFDCTGDEATHCAIEVYEITGARNGAPVRQSNSFQDTATVDPHCVFDSNLLATSGYIAIATKHANTSFTPMSGWTEDTDAAFDSSSRRAMAQHRVGGETTALDVIFDCASSPDTITCLVVEIAAPVANTKAVAGTMTSAGAIARKTKKTVAGTLTTAGILIRKAKKAVAGALTSAGALAAEFISGVVGTLYYQAVDGTLAFSGNLSRTTKKALAGTLSSAGSVIRVAKKALSGTLSSAGAVARKTSRALSGVLASSGGLVRKAKKALAGTLTSAGSLATRISVLIHVSVGGVLSFVGGIVRWRKEIIPGIHGAGATAIVHGMEHVKLTHGIQHVAIVHGEEHVKRVHGPKEDDTMHSGEWL